MPLTTPDETQLHLVTAGPDALGAALALLAMQDGLRVRAAVVAGAAPSVLQWTDEDERRCAQTAKARRGATDVDDDTMAAPVEALVERLPQAAGHRVPDDHFTAPASPEFTELVIAAARR